MFVDGCAETHVANLMVKMNRFRAFLLPE